MLVIGSEIGQRTRRTQFVTQIVELYDRLFLRIARLIKMTLLILARADIAQQHCRSPAVVDFKQELPGSYVVGNSVREIAPVETDAGNIGNATGNAPSIAGLVKMGSGLPVIRQSIIISAGIRGHGSQRVDALSDKALVTQGDGEVPRSGVEIDCFIEIALIFGQRPGAAQAVGQREVRFAAIEIHNLSEPAPALSQVPPYPPETPNPPESGQPDRHHRRQSQTTMR